jgi:hypothetical protein
MNYIKGVDGWTPFELNEYWLDRDKMEPEKAFAWWLPGIAYMIVGIHDLSELAK